MRIKNEAEYVIRILLYLSKNGRTRNVPTSELVVAEKIPSAFCSRITKNLEKKGYIKIAKGTKGGNMLIKNPKEITLRDAVEAVEEIIIKDCVESPEDCKVRGGNCAVNRVFSEIQRYYLDKLDSINFADLADEVYK